MIERREVPIPVRTAFSRLYMVGMTCFRLILCPGDDVLAVTAAATIGVIDGNIKEAIMPRDEIDDFIKELRQSSERLKYLGSNTYS